MTSLPISPQAGLLFWQQHQARVRSVVVTVLAAYLLYFLADVVWRVVPAPTLITAKATTVSKPVAKNAQTRIDIDKLQALHLFGKQKEAPIVQATPVETDAPETTLNLTLTGVVSSSDVESGAAIILHQGTQMTYGVGEKIDGTNATLRQVLADRVIIRNGVRDETLMLDGVDFKSPARPAQQTARSAPATTGRKATTTAKTVSAEAVAAGEALRAQPENFTDYIAISPMNQDGALVGYQVKPGRDPALFEAAGLKNGDIVVQINGMDLTDPQQAMDAMSEMRSAQSIELTVMRDGSYATIYLDMPSEGEVE